MCCVGYVAVFLKVTCEYFLIYSLDYISWALDGNTCNKAEKKKFEIQKIILFWDLLIPNYVLFYFVNNLFLSFQCQRVLFD